MASPSFVPASVIPEEQVFVDHISNGDLLRRHIVNGASRGLYSMALAKAAITALEGLEPALKQAYIESLSKGA